MNELVPDISRHIWETNYRCTDRGVQDQTITDTWRRIASALAAVEPEDGAAWEKRFFNVLQDFKFLPGGRIQAGAGT